MIDREGKQMSIARRTLAEVCMEDFPNARFPAGYVRQNIASREDQLVSLSNVAHPLGAVAILRDRRRLNETVYVCLLLNSLGRKRGGPNQLTIAANRTSGPCARLPNRVPEAHFPQFIEDADFASGSVHNRCSLPA